MHVQVRPPASYGTLCSKSACAAGRRQPGPVQVAYRIWVKCRSSTPGSCPRACGGQVAGQVRVGEPCAGGRTHGSKRRGLEREHPATVTQ